MYPEPPDDTEASGNESVFVYIGAKFTVLGYRSTSVHICQSSCLLPIVCVTEKVPEPYVPALLFS